MKFAIVFRGKSILTVRFVEKFGLEIPKVLRQVDFVFLRVDNSAVFGEKLFYVFVFVVADLFERRLVVNEFSVLENGHHEFLDFVVGESGLFPGLLGMENRERLRSVKSLVFKTNKVRLRHAVLEDTHDLFHAGIGGLFVAVRDLDLWHEFAVFFECAEFIHAA